jgi:DNA primase
MPPVRKALALLLTYPALAGLESNHDEWLTDETDSDCVMLGRLLKVLHERPHYNLSHLIGYWRGVYGAENTERLAAVAGHDLLQAANALTRTRPDKPPKADYDTQTAFNDAMEKLRQQRNQKKTAESLAKLKNADLTQLTKEERDQLVHAALASKMQP